MWCSYWALTISGLVFLWILTRFLQFFLHIEENWTLTRARVPCKANWDAVCDIVIQTKTRYNLTPSIKFYWKKVPINNKKSRKKICRAKLHMYSILHYITNCLYFHIISTTKKYIETQKWVHSRVSKTHSQCLQKCYIFAGSHFLVYRECVIIKTSLKLSS